MKLNKSAYLFAAALVASTMGMTSCSSEDEIGVETVAGQEAKVTLGLSVRGANSRAAADMNFGKETTITNVAVVPFIDNAAQKPIQWASVTSTTDPKTVQMSSLVNSFKVYGNLTSDQYAKTLNSFTLTKADFALSQIQGKTGVDGAACYNPHASLYYFKNATEFYRATIGTDWASVTEENWGAAATGAINNAKFIKIDNVDYAVGTLVASIMNGDNTACFYDNAGLTGNAQTAADANVKVSGIMIEDQKDLDENLAPTGDDKVVFEEAEGDGAFAAGPISSSSDALTKGNIFVIVSPTEENKEINANIEFTLPKGVFLKKTDGTPVGSADSETKIYLAVKMKTAAAASETGSTYNINKVFAAGYVTILNATVKNWGIASTTPVTVTDAQIGVVFDVAWKQGNLYNVEI